MLRHLVMRHQLCHYLGSHRSGRLLLPLYYAGSDRLNIFFFYVHVPEFFWKRRELKRILGQSIRTHSQLRAKKSGASKCSIDCEHFRKWFFSYFCPFFMPSLDLSISFFLLARFLNFFLTAIVFHFGIVLFIHNFSLLWRFSFFLLARFFNLFLTAIVFYFYFFLYFFIRHVNNPYVYVTCM